jgi:hypothetical protein
MRYTKRIEILGDDFTYAGLAVLANVQDRSRGYILRQLVKQELAKLGIISLAGLVDNTSRNPATRDGKEY